MTDFTDPKFWIDGAKLVWAAPQITIPLIIGVVVATWGARACFASDRTAHLRAQIDSLNARLQLKDDQIADAKADYAKVVGQMEQLQKRAAVQDAEIATLRSSLSPPARIDQLVRANTEFQGALIDLANSTSNLGHTLTITGGQYRLAVEPVSSIKPST